jgi:two-component system cell cycle sensor histidine kinase/response regulator CckA
MAASSRRSSSAPLPPALIVELETGRILLASEKFLELSEYPSGELIGRTAAELRIWADEKAPDPVLAGARSTPVRASLRKRSGEVREVLVEVQPGAGCILATVTVPVEKVASSRLQEIVQSGKLFLELVECCRDFVCVSTLEGQVVYVNPAGRRLVGVAPDADVTGASLGDYYTEEGARLVRTVVHDRVVEDGFFQGEVQMRNPGTGEVIDVETESFLLPPQAPGDPPLVANIERDVRDTRRLQARLAQAERMESVGRLAGGIAHDFNNMLSVVLGFTDLARGRIPSGHPAAADLDEVTKSAERASLLTKQLLAFGKQQSIHGVPIDVSEVVRGLERTLRQVAGDRVQVEICLCPGQAVVTADPGQLEQVLLNLVANARDAMRSGGVLRIATGEKVLDEEAGHREGLPPGKYAALSVRDAGTGMDRATLERIFEPFFTTKRPGSGTGLGLATVYGIVRQTGGAVQVESAPGKGSEFRVLLPRTDLPTPRSVRPLSRPAAATRHARVLVVEDRKNLRLLVERCLREAGYEVVAAESGAGIADAALKADVLLTDVALRGPSGPEVAAALRRKTPRLRVIYMTGQDPEQAGALEPTGRLLPKPFKPEQLLEAVRAELDDAA